MPSFNTPPAGIDTLIDRDLQQDVLIRLVEEKSFDAVNVALFFGEPNTEKYKKACYNLEYLRQQGLVELQTSIQSPNDGGALSVSITHQGIDAVLGDGGLLSQKDCALVQLQAMTVRRLLKVNVMGSQLLPSEKLHVIACLQQLQIEALTALSLNILELAITDMPELWRLLRAKILAESNIPDTPSEWY